MVAINAFVHLFKFVVGIFLSYEFEEGCRKTSFIKGPRKRENVADLALSLEASFRSLGNVPFNKLSHMGSIQLGEVITGKISSLLMFIEGSERCLTGIRLSMSSYDVVAKFARAFACEFSALGTYLT